MMIRKPHIATARVPFLRKFHLSVLLSFNHCYMITLNGNKPHHTFWHCNEPELGDAKRSSFRCPQYLQCNCMNIGSCSMLVWQYFAEVRWKNIPWIVDQTMRTWEKDYKIQAWCVMIVDYWLFMISSPRYISQYVLIKPSQVAIS